MVPELGVSLCWVKHSSCSRGSVFTVWIVSCREAISDKRDDINGGNNKPSASLPTICAEQDNFGLCVLTTCCVIVGSHRCLDCLRSESVV